MKPLTRCCDELRRRLLAAIEVESSLAGKLREHEHALMHGEVERILSLNAELDTYLGTLREVAVSLQESAIQLAELLNLPSRTPLKESLVRLPPHERDELIALRQRLLLSRRAAQNASDKNAQIARASLDAIQGMRELLGQPLSEAGAVAEPAGISGRLDAEA